MTQPVWLEIEESLLIHEQLLADHGGASGMRAKTLLESVLARPKQHFSYKEAKDFLSLGAIYTAGIVQNHPFVDGNKRTGFVVGVLFLELNGHTFNASEEDAACAVLALASGEMNEEQYAEFLRENCNQREQRKLYNRPKSGTVKELEGCLKWEGATATLKEMEKAIMAGALS